jgi:hypothetical protein
VIWTFLDSLFPPKLKQFAEFTEAERKRIWIELSQAQRATMNTVDNEFPDVEASHPDYSKREAFRTSLYEQLHQKFTQKYRITQEQLKEIQLEGLSKDWPDTLDPETVASYPFTKAQDVAASMNCQYALLAWDKWEMYKILMMDGKRTVKKISNFPRSVDSL